MAGQRTQLLTPAEAASMLAVSRKTLSKLVTAMAIPHVRLSPRCVRFTLADLERWIEKKRRDSWRIW